MKNTNIDEDAYLKPFQFQCSAARQMLKNNS